MPRPANPYTKVAKRVASLQAKAAKLNAEIASLADLVANETKKPTKASLKATSSVEGSKRRSSKAETKKAVKPKSKNPNSVSATKTKARPVASKPRSSKGKAEQPAKVDYLSRLNDEPDIVSAPKKRGKK